MNPGRLLSPEQVKMVTPHSFGIVRNKNDFAAGGSVIPVCWRSVLAIVVIALQCPAVRAVEKDTCRSTSHCALSLRYLSRFSVFRHSEATGFLDLFLNTPFGGVCLFGLHFSNRGLTLEHGMVRSNAHSRWCMEQESASCQVTGIC